MELLFLIMIVLFLIFAEGFFAGTEFGVVAFNRIRLNYLVKEGNKSAILLSNFLKKSHLFLGTTLVGTNLCTVLNSVIITSFLSFKFGEEKGASLTIVIFTPMTLLLGEILPKMVFQSKKESLPLNVAFVLNFFFKVLSPVVKILTFISGRLLRIVKVKKEYAKTFLKDDIEYLFFSESFGKKFDPTGMKILQRVFDFNKIEVNDIIVPLIKLEAAPNTCKVADIIEIIKRTGFSRIPVYEGEVYNITGIVYGFDLLSALDLSQSIEKYIKRAYYIPKNMRISKLLRELQKRKLQLAVVVDEYGGNMGIVTMEDLLEELVGDIIDEYDIDEFFLKKISKNLYLVNAQTRISELNKHFDINIPKKDFETIGGLLLHFFEHIPQKGEKITCEGLTFIVKEVTSTKIDWVLVKIEDE
jgi:putative hemolysin